MSRFFLSFVLFAFLVSPINANTIRLKPLTSGPVIYGMPDESNYQVNLWGRGYLPENIPFEDRINWSTKSFTTFGVAAISRKGEDKPFKTVRFEMFDEHDHIGTKALKDLSPGDYDIKMGYYTTRTEDIQRHSKHDFDFVNCDEGHFHIAAKDQDHFSFLLGSCRLFSKVGPFTLFGTGKKADKIFGSMLEDICDTEINGGIKTEFYLSMGDHVYYDRLGPVLPVTSLRKMRKLYRNVRKYPNLHKLMTNHRFYAMGDDHDMHSDNSNWQKRQDDPETFKNGMTAFREYQHWGGPCSSADHMWHSFSSGITDFFMLDTRSERDERLVDDEDNAKEPTLISERQFKAFKAWITSDKRKGRVVFIVTPVSLAGEDNMDGWMGCPVQQKEMLTLIAKTKNAFILTGDSHGTRCSTYDVTDSNYEKLGSVTELMSSGLKSGTFSIPDNFPDELDMTEEGGVYLTKTDTTQLYPYASRSKAHRRNWLMKRIGTYVKGVFMRVTVDVNNEELHALIHDKNLDNPIEKIYDLDLTGETSSGLSESDNPDASLSDDDEDTVEPASTRQSSKKRTSIPTKKKIIVKKRTKKKTAEKVRL